jgi:hypothetical protein
MGKGYSLPETIEDSDLEKLHEYAGKIHVGLKKEDKDASYDSAVVLGIFAAFNPENRSMLEEDIEFLFLAYQKWLDKKLSLN